MMCVSLEKNSGFVGIVWSSSVETYYEEEVERVLKDTPPVVGAGAVDSERV